MSNVSQQPIIDELWFLSLVQYLVRGFANTFHIFSFFITLSLLQKKNLVKDHSTGWDEMQKNSPIPLATSVMTYKPFEFIDSAAARNMLWFLKVRDPWWVVAGAGAVVVANLPYCSFEQ